MMNTYIRPFLYILLAIIGLSLWNAWQQDVARRAALTASYTNAATHTASPALPPASVVNLHSANATPAAAVASATHVPNQSVITVNTDVLGLKISPVGGNIIEAKLPKYPVSLEQPHVPIQLLNEQPNTLYIAQSGLLGLQGPDTPDGQATYQTTAPAYQLAPDQKQMDVVFNWEKDGLLVRKIFTLKRGNYDIGVRYEIENRATTPWQGQLYGQVRRKPEVSSNSLFSLHTYTGAAISTTDDSYQKIPFSKMESQNLNKETPGGWLAVQQRYFLSAWVPDVQQVNRYYSTVDPDKVYTIGFLGPQLSVQPGAKAQAKASFYVGPELAEPLRALAPHLDLTVDYGWLWPISVAILAVMKFIYSIIGNWGWAIVIVTLLIKLLFYKLSETSYRSMAKLRRLTPQLQSLKERFGDDRQKLSQATMELYRREKVNPLGGCLPILVQIPFFIALYYVLSESVELRQAPFILWIKDLSVKDPYYILPVLMGISMFVQQKLNPPPPDPTQEKVMMAMPVVFTAFFLAFPAGLVLYWLVNNCLSILQQWFIMRRVEKADDRKNKPSIRKKS